MIERLLDGAQPDDKGGLRIPIRLQTGVERTRVIHDAIEQIRSVADAFLEAYPPAG